MYTQIVFKNVQTTLGYITVKATISTVKDLFDFLKECYQEHGFSFKFIQKFVSDYFPKLLLRFINHFINEVQNALVGWLTTFLKLFK